MTSLTLHKEYPSIFGQDKNGKTRVWNASVFQEADNAIAVIQHGIYAGKLQVDTRQYTVGKNIGKKNETSPLEQCILETEKKRKDKIEKENYSVVFPSAAAAAAATEETRTNCPSDKQELRKIFPMLANKYEPISSAKKRQGIVYPCYVQPKLDGLRCVVYLGSNGRPVYQSRTGGTFTVLQHLDSSILGLFERRKELILDGELYTSQIPFEELAGIIKKKTLSDDDLSKIRAVEYHIYDIVEPDVPYNDRMMSLQNILLNAGPSIVPVATFRVESVAEFKEKFSEFVEQGYEGIMLRNAAGLYKENYRSNDLMKYKEFMESEYPIVDYREATGRDEGTVIWVCSTPDQRLFSVRPRGTVEMRRKWFKEGERNIGKQLTVIYQELSEMGVPRFPVGKAIRDGW
jgi:DNA ligase-1